jgi:hypothetical protein
MTPGWFCCSIDNSCVYLQCGDHCVEIFLQGDEIVLRGDFLATDETRVKLKPQGKEANKIAECPDQRSVRRLERSRTQEIR